MLGAGLTDVSVRVFGDTPDTTGFTRGILDSMLHYGRTFDRISEARADELRTALDEALATGTYEVLVPQFFVTAQRP